MKRLIFVAVAMAACGGSEKPADKTTPTPEGTDHGTEHAKLTPELDAFHEALAPRWHADPGEARVTDTCGATADFATKADAIAAAAAPAGADATAWTEAGVRLQKSVAALAAVCGGDRAGFDAAFTEVHDAFHGAMELQMGGHEEHEHGMGHEHGMEHGAETGGMKH